MLHQSGIKCPVQRGHALIIKMRCHGCVYRHSRGLHTEVTTVTLHLLTYVPQSVLGAFTITLIDRDEIRMIQHFDLLKL